MPQNNRQCKCFVRFYPLYLLHCKFFKVYWEGDRQARDNPQQFAQGKLPKFKAAKHQRASEKTHRPLCMRAEKKGCEKSWLYELKSDLMNRRSR